MFQNILAILFILKLVKRSKFYTPKSKIRNTLLNLIILSAKRLYSLHLIYLNYETEMKWKLPEYIKPHKTTGARLPLKSYRINSFKPWTLISLN